MTPWIVAMSEAAAEGDLFHVLAWTGTRLQCRAGESIREGDRVEARSAGYFRTGEPPVPVGVALETVRFGLTVPIQPPGGDTLNRIADGTILRGQPVRLTPGSRCKVFR